MTIDFTKKIFLADAAVCAFTFLACVSVTGMIAADTGLTPVIVASGGWICLGAALLWGWLGTRSIPPVPICWVAIGMNAAWILASLGVVAVYSADLTPAGRALILAQAAGVVGFVTLQIIGTRAITRRQIAAA